MPRQNNAIARYLERMLSLTPSATLNTAAKRNFRRLAHLLEKQGAPTEQVLLLNVGGGERFLGAQGLGQPLLQRVITIDILPIPTINVQADAHYLPFADASVNCAICQAVLEHVLNAEQVIAEMYRVLMGGGLIYAEIPFLQGFHAVPFDFRRCTIPGIEQLFSAFVKVDSGVCVGPSSALSWILRCYLAGLFSGFRGDGMAYRLAYFVSSWLTFPLKYIDLVVADRPAAEVIASGVYYLGIKP